ncbi:hypothetical protein ABOM_010244 [Aspergillus bombycis]|uniref:Heterokaryon incompatibility domain-containing protein n=1 Tax=Aspergillus bombycis TaxID=109264 RepID=A0A1F7ZNM6_9EURO|nr:hypothetical protein ABOM_010244 [Aspergillus bombycis]OGM41060.1 hypothetical protein ABOM_010244 [Aspergillus bombycis]
MITVALAEVKHEYHALSYTWGDDLPSKPISINNYTVLVSEKQHDMPLRYQDMVENDPREEFRMSLPLWVDAICINQEDIPEKGSQVGMMGLIYESTYLVLAWIGSAADDSDYAVGGIAALSWEIITAAQQDQERLAAIRPEHKHLWQNDGSESWERFCDVAPRHARVALSAACGSRVMGLDKHRYWTEGFKVVYILRFRPYQASNWGPQKHGSSARTWVRLLDWTQSRQASESRDKLFSMNALASGGIKPDYTLSSEDVYTQFTAQVVLETGRLDLPWYAGHGALAESKEAIAEHPLFLPSWVPNWDAFSKDPKRVMVFSHDVTPYGECHRLAPRARPHSVSGCALNAYGVQCDNVSKCHRFHGDQSKFMLFWLEHAGKAQDSRRYVTGIPILQAMARLLLLDLDPETEFINNLSCEPRQLVKAVVHASGMFTTDSRSVLEDYGLTNPSSMATYLDQDSCTEDLWQDYLSAIYQAVANSCATLALAGRNLTYRLDTSFFTTNSGYLRCGPLNMRKEDSIPILFGYPRPVVLRRVDSHYIYI